MTNEDEINGYCINLITNQNKTGYITVSTNLSEPLIQEYSDAAALMVETQDNSITSIDAMSRSLDRIYYYGPLSYSTNKYDRPNICSSAEDEANTDNLNNASAYVNYLRENGILPYTDNKIEIENSLTYLQERYPGCIIKGDEYYNMGDESIDGYIISGWNACGEHGTAAILKYYLGDSYAYSTIVNNCKSIARNNGYAAFDSGKNEWNYYIDIGKLAPFVNDCIDYYHLSKTASSSLLTWSTGTYEISHDRPILLNIGYSEQYDDHTVTAFAWSQFNVILGDNLTIRFFKVKDGYTSQNRYVNFNQIVGSYITKVV